MKATARLVVMALLGLTLVTVVRARAEAMVGGQCPSPEPTVCEVIPIPPYGTFEWYGIPQPQ